MVAGGWWWGKGLTTKGYKNFLEWSKCTVTFTMEVNTPLNALVKTHWAFYLKLVNFTAYKLYLNKTHFKKNQDLFLKPEREGESFYFSHPNRLVKFCSQNFTLKIISQYQFNDTLLNLSNIKNKVRPGSTRFLLQTKQYKFVLWNFNYSGIHREGIDKTRNWTEQQNWSQYSYYTSSSQNDFFPFFFLKKGPKPKLHFIYHRSMATHLH